MACTIKHSQTIPGKAFVEFAREIFSQKAFK